MRRPVDMNTVIEDAATAENKINKMKRARLSNGPAELKRGDLLQGSNDSYIIKSPIDRGESEPCFKANAFRMG